MYHPCQSFVFSSLLRLAFDWRKWTTRECFYLEHKDWGEYIKTKYITLPLNLSSFSHLLSFTYTIKIDPFESKFCSYCENFSSSKIHVLITICRCSTPLEQAVCSSFETLPLFVIAETNNERCSVYCRVQVMVYPFSMNVLGVANNTSPSNNSSVLFL